MSRGEKLSSVDVHDRVCVVDLRMVEFSRSPTTSKSGVITVSLPARRALRLTPSEPFRRHEERHLQGS
jgi:hypothetical protein